MTWLHLGALRKLDENMHAGTSFANLSDIDRDGKVQAVDNSAHDYDGILGG